MIVASGVLDEDRRRMRRLIAMGKTWQMHICGIDARHGVKALRPKRKRGLAIAGGVVALIIIAGIVAALLFNINAYKSKIETVASEASGLDVRINGKMGLSLFPLGVSARNIHVASEGAELLSLESLKIGVELMPLLRRQLEVTSCELIKPAVTIVKTVEGKYNFESLERKLAEGPRAAFNLKDLRLSEGTLGYLDKETGEKTESRGINLAVKNLLIADISGEIIRNVSFTGRFDCKEVLRKNLRVENLKASVKADKGVYSLKPLSMDVLGGKGEGEVTADKSEADATYEVDVKVSKLDFEKLEESFGIKKVIGGKGELSASLTGKEKGRRNPMSNLDGTFALRGDNLVTYTMDLDKVLSTYEASQKFHLVDLAAFFFVGPIGTVALKGYRYGDVYYQTQRGKGTITRFISHWKIKNGEADATDCALATHHNRVALKGKLNLVGERFDNVTVALLDDQGCPIFKQTISGPFGSPRVGTVSAVESLAGPFLDLYRKAKRFVQGGKCEVFYNGSVQQPR
jgi:AsmA protein